MNTNILSFCFKGTMALPVEPFEISSVVASEFLKVHDASPTRPLYARLADELDAVRLTL